MSINDHLAIETIFYENTHISYLSEECHKLGYVSSKIKTIQYLKTLNLLYRWSGIIPDHL